MGKADVLPGGNGRCPANCRMTVSGEQQSSEDLRLLNEKMIDRYGAMAILALDGDAIAGFVSYFPTWCPHFNICDDGEISEAIGRISDIECPPVCEDPALHVRCLVVRKEFRGNGLAVAMLECLKQWAWDHGWRAIVGNGCIFSGRAQYQWLVSPKPPRPIWEKAGFVPGEYAPLKMTAVCSEESARASRDWYLSYRFPAHVPRDVKADETEWREISADYTMICRL